MNKPKKRTRIQERNRASILEAALEVFSKAGFRGATLDQIASTAGLSKPNLLYYYASKEAIHAELLSGLMENWLEPLEAMNPDGEPVDEIIGYVLRKLEMARSLPRESRLFANEIVQGAPRILPEISGPLKTLVDQKTKAIQDWVEAGRIAKIDPYHLIFSIWATTQHYADFDVQIRAILTPEANEHFSDAEAFLKQMYRAMLKPH